MRETNLHERYGYAAPQKPTQHRAAVVASPAAKTRHAPYAPSRNAAVPVPVARARRKLTSIDALRATIARNAMMIAKPEAAASKGRTTISTTPVPSVSTNPALDAAMGLTKYDSVQSGKDGASLVFGRFVAGTAPKSAPGCSVRRPKAERTRSEGRRVLVEL